jgi:hypothetical protein
MTPALQRFWYATLILMTILVYTASCQTLAESKTESQSQVTFYVH